MNHPGMAVVRRRPNFACIPHELIDDETITAQAKVIYATLDRYADYETSLTFVGKEKVAAKTHFKKASSIDPYLAELKAKGWISWSRRWRRDTGERAEGGRIVYEYSFSPGEGFEPTTNLYMVNDRLDTPIISGEGIPPTGDIGVSPAEDVPVSPTGDTNENQKNENQKNIKDLVESGDSTTVAKKPGRVNYPPEFEALWKMYPNRNGSKKKAFEQYKSALKRVDYEVLEVGIRDLVAWQQRNRKESQYIRHAERWFRHDGWDDELVDEQPRQDRPQRTNTAEAWLGLPEGALGDQRPFGGFGFDALRGDTVDGQVVEQRGIEQ